MSDYVNNVNIVNDDTKKRGLPETVHIIPLGHEIDRAVKPFTKKTANRAYILAIPRDADFDLLTPPGICDAVRLYPGDPEGRGL